MARLSKTEIKQIAKDMNAMESLMEECSGNMDRQDTFFENLGAFFYTQKLIQTMGVGNLVYEVRQALKAERLVA